jgi:5-methylcytosine-specific restriction endonuclease McrA
LPLKRLGVRAHQACRYPKPRPVTYQCQWCGVSVEGSSQNPRKFCKDACKLRAVRQRLSKDPEWVARNQAREAARVRAARICPICETSYHPTCGDQLYCSRQCGAIANRTRWPASRITVLDCRCGKAFVWRKGTSTSCSARCRRDRQRAWRAARGAVGQIGDTVVLACIDCSQDFTWIVSDGGRIRRCPTCREARRKAVSQAGKHTPAAKAARARRRRARRQAGKDDRGHRHRARKYGVPWEPINRQAVFERDRWRCQLCRKPLARTKKAPHPRSPSVDCIVPLSQPGSPGYVLANVQAAHFQCNALKGARGGGEQLRLV